MTYKPVFFYTTGKIPGYLCMNIQINMISNKKLTCLYETSNLPEKKRKKNISGENDSHLHFENDSHLH